MVAYYLDHLRRISARPFNARLERRTGGLAGGSGIYRGSLYILWSKLLAARYALLRISLYLQQRFAVVALFLIFGL
jgi:hypothetical protein